MSIGHTQREIPKAGTAQADKDDKDIWQIQDLQDGHRVADRHDCKQVWTVANIEVDSVMAKEKQKEKPLAV